MKSGGENPLVGASPNDKFWFGCSDNFLSVKVFFGELLSEDVVQKVAYDGFAFFCKLFHYLLNTLTTATT